MGGAEAGEEQCEVILSRRAKKKKGKEEALFHFPAFQLLLSTLGNMIESNLEKEKCCFNSHHPH